jgi:hypothetical protein
MTPLEAIPKITELLSTLIERVKDGKTAALVQQIQTLYQSVQSGYFEAEHKALDYHSNVVRLEAELLEVKRSLKKKEDERLDETTLLKSQMQELELKLKKLNSQALYDWMKQKVAQQAEFRKRHDIDYSA